MTAAVLWLVLDCSELCKDDVTSVLMCVGPEEQQSGYNQASKGWVCNETFIKADIQIETPKQELTTHTQVNNYTVVPRAYKRREGMQLLYEQSSNVGGWMCMTVHEMLKIEISIFSTSCKCTHSSAHVWTLLATCTDSGVACPLFFYTPLVVHLQLILNQGMYNY